MENVELIEKKNIELIEEKIESSNIIQDVSYSAKDTKGNEYFLKANEGTIDQNQSNFIFLKFVKGIINLKDYALILFTISLRMYNYQYFLERSPFLSLRL